MIIKKKKNNNKENNDDKFEKNEKFKSIELENKPESFTNIFDNEEESSERQERRRGDRRRGYRRIEDRSLVSRAHEEAKIIKEQAVQDGFQQGLSQADTKIIELQDIIASLIGIKEEAYGHYKNDIVMIALEVAKKILGAEVKLNSEVIVEIATNVIKEISEEESKITFVINPEDELVLSENLENNSVFKNKRATMSIQTNSSIERGSCKVITNSGQIDATFSSQLAIIKKAFEEGM